MAFNLYLIIRKVRPYAMSYIMYQKTHDEIYLYIKESFVICPVSVSL